MDPSSCHQGDPSLVSMYVLGTRLFGLFVQTGAIIDPNKPKKGHFGAIINPKKGHFGPFLGHLIPKMALFLNVFPRGTGRPI